MNLDEIDDLEYSYLQMHHLMNILELIVRELAQTEHLSDNVIFLYKVILEKRDIFHADLDKFLTKHIAKI